MKLTSILLAGIALVLGFFSLIGGNSHALTYMEVTVGILFICLGIIQFREHRKAIGAILCIAGGFGLFVSAYLY